MPKWVMVLLFMVKCWLRKKLKIGTWLYNYISNNTFFGQNCWSTFASSDDGHEGIITVLTEDYNVEETFPDNQEQVKKHFGKYSLFTKRLRSITWHGSLDGKQLHNQLYRHSLSVLLKVISRQFQFNFRLSGIVSALSSHPDMEILEVSLKVRECASII